MRQDAAGDYSKLGENMIAELYREWPNDAGVSIPSI